VASSGMDPDVAIFSLQMERRFNAPELASFYHAFKDGFG
jgi:hypothetical protein